MAMGNNNSITAEQVNRISQHPIETLNPIIFVIAKRKPGTAPAHLQQDWSTFDQMRIILHHIVDTDVVPLSPIQNNKLITVSSPPTLPNNTPTMMSDTTSQQHTKTDTTNTSPQNVTWDNPIV